MYKHFELKADFTPSGDQPAAIEELVRSVNDGNKYTTLLGVTGSGKTYTIANLIEKTQRPVLVISHNKVLAAQLCNEFKSFFPENSVEFFVSYYDYYQPEAYIAYSNTYIEKDAQVNKEIERLRHSATQAILLRPDTIVVSSVSAIYGLGSPQDYESFCLRLDVGKDYDRDELLAKLISMQFKRTEDTLESGSFRVKGGTIELIPSDRESILKLDFFGEELERISQIDPISGDVIMLPENVMIFPATHYVLLPERMQKVIVEIKSELDERFAELRMLGKEEEAARLWERTQYDLEMIREMGYCHGIENYSRHFDGRKAGEPPFTLQSYFQEDCIVVVDESHVTIPQLRAMFNGDRSRKKNLVDYGFRLPSAFDNRPLSFEEFLQRCPQVVFVSATPGPFELEVSDVVVEQIIRPTGLPDPEIEIAPSKGQMARLLKEIKIVAERSERVLITTLTKKMSEELTEYLLEKGVRARYMHSDIDTLDRIQILFGLRRGEFDVLVGINLLREGLDLPEVSLVAILDADKEGFLRSETTMIQTMGRAARNHRGRVIMFADRETESMKRAISETIRRRTIQINYNKQYNIEPRTIVKQLQDRFETSSYRVSDRRLEIVAKQMQLQSVANLTLHIDELEKQMWEAADKHDFETAAIFRDEIFKIKQVEKKKKRKAVEITEPIIPEIS